MSSVYSRDIAILKQIGSYYKLTQMNYVKEKGFELDSYIQKNTVNTEKLNNNITRARTTVRELGYCNQWELFFTFTINQQFYDRYNLADFRKVLSQWIRNYNKKYSLKIKYLLIPEQHKDGAWHFHGFLIGLPISHLKKFEIGDIMGQKIADKVLAGCTVYNWLAYQGKFGFCSLETIRNQERAVNYIIKYITKELAQSVDSLGAHLYYASKGLERAEELKRGKLLQEIPIDFENEHCKITNFSAVDYTAAQLENIILGKYEELERVAL